VRNDVRNHLAPTKWKGVSTAAHLEVLQASAHQLKVDAKSTATSKCKKEEEIK
jgi:hypothetical protein